MATIAQLAQREAKLVADLAKVREEIASRAGEVDAKPKPVVKSSGAPQRRVEKD